MIAEAPARPEVLEVESGKRRESQIRDVERQRRHLWTTLLISLCSVSLVVVVMSYWTDVVPDDLGRVDFKWLRFAFLVVAVGFAVYSVRRERMLARLERRLKAEQKRAEGLASRFAQIEELNEVRSDAVAMVTHELKTPLTSLLGYASIVRKRHVVLSAEQREQFFEVMEKQGARIMQLIEDLLQSSRLENGAGALRRVPLDLAAIARGVAQEQSTGRGRAVEVRAPDTDLGLFGDPAAMEHVVTNLVDNALKYSPVDSAVRIDVAEGDGEVLLSVADEGEGIPADDMPHVFERFQQAANAKGRSSVGLGLYIVRNLVQAHSGRVWVDSEPGRGTTFTVALPRRRR